MRDQRNWVVGFTGYAIIMMIMIGIFGAFAGLVGILEDEIYRTQRNYVFDFGAFGWGIIHMVVGIAIVAAAVMLLMGAVWARTIAVVLAAISAITNFMAIPYYPAWSMVVLFIDIGVIWALTMHGTEIISGADN